MALANIDGLMAESIEGSGVSRCFMVLVVIHGLMAKYIKESTDTIRKKAMGFTYCKITESFKAGGLTESNTGLAS